MHTFTKLQDRRIPSGIAADSVQCFRVAVKVCRSNVHTYMYTHVTHRRDSLSDTRYSFVMTTKASIYRVDRNCLLLFDTAIQEQNEMFLPNI